MERRLTYFFLNLKPVVLLSAALIILSGPALALGPNLLINGGFEGGDYNYQAADVQPFAIVKDRSNAHSGSWVLRSKIQGDGSCSLHSPVYVWPNTKYTSSLWYRGNGTLQLSIFSGDMSAQVASVKFTAASAWRKVSVSYTTGNIGALQISIREVGGTGKVLYLDDLYTGLTDANTIAFDPNRPTSSGMKLLFGDDFNDSSTIDIKNSQHDGYHWYLNQFYHLPDTTPNMFSVHDGVLTITDCPVGFSDTLHTATPAKNKEGFIGTVFKDTVPLFFVSRFRVRNFDKTGTTKGDPCFWSQDVNMGTPVPSYVPGHPGHKEFIENDFVEMNHKWGGKAGEHIAGYGDWCDAGSIGDAVTQWPPDGTDYGQYHTYGCLLVPATAANGWHGYRTIYFDGVAMASNCWIGNQTYNGVFPETRASMGSYLWSMIDRHWEDMIVGDGQGGVSPMDVDYIRVYGMSSSSVWVVRNH